MLSHSESVFSVDPSKYARKGRHMRKNIDTHHICHLEPQTRHVSKIFSQPKRVSTFFTTSKILGPSCVTFESSGFLGVLKHNKKDKNIGKIRRKRIFNGCGMPDI